MNLFKKMHRLGAVILSVFIVSHLLVHLSAYWGATTHLATLDAVQGVYRNRLGEALLVGVILSQIFTGVRRLSFRGQTGWPAYRPLAALIC